MGTPELTSQELLNFLKKIDNLFPVPLSKKQELSAFAVKLCEKATICVQQENGKIVSIVAGYTDHLQDNMAYISIVATLPEAQGKGYAAALLQEFLDIAKRKSARAAHVYAVPTNLPAISMYRRVGFVDLRLENEPRPNDAHLIYYLGEGN